MLKSKWNKILGNKKWKNKEFARNQLKHHLEEVSELLKKDDEHLEKELIDLYVICIAVIREQYKDKDESTIKDILEKLENERYKKFVSKLQCDVAQK